MHRLLVAAFVAAALLGVTACSGNNQGASASSSPSATPSHTALPGNPKTSVTFAFNDVAISTGGANTLRLGFDMANASDDPMLCDPSEFNVQLSDGTVIAADGSADDSCDPDSVDPHSSGKAVMYFDLPRAYTGPVTMFFVVDDVIRGQGTTNLK